MIDNWQFFSTADTKRHRNNMLKLFLVLLFTGAIISWKWRTNNSIFHLILNAVEILREILATTAFFFHDSYYCEVSTLYFLLFIKHIVKGYFYWILNYYFETAVKQIECKFNKAVRDKCYIRTTAKSSTCIHTLHILMMA